MQKDLDTGRQLYDQQLVDADSAFLNNSGLFMMEPASTYSLTVPNSTVDYTKQGFYAFPFPNGSSAFYTLSAQQTADLNQCVYASTYKLPLSNAIYILGPHLKTYFGFESGLFCREPTSRDGFDFSFD